MKIGRTNACGGGSIEHNDTLNRNNDPNFLHITQKEKNDFVNASDFAINHNSSKDTHLGSIWNPIILTTTEDLNDLISPGVYYQPRVTAASIDHNYPLKTAGSLEVVKTTDSDTTGVNQIYRTYNNGSQEVYTFIRGYYKSSTGTASWSAWKKIIDEEDLNSAIDNINDNLNNKIEFTETSAPSTQDPSDAFATKKFVEEAKELFLNNIIGDINSILDKINGEVI